MKKTILIYVLVMLMLAGCSGSKTAVEFPTAPPQASIEPETSQTTPASAEVAETEPATVATTAPTEAPTTEPETAATTAPTDPPGIVITKHPTSETVSEGARTWFIANAENETQITWEFFSPDGTMYSLQQAMSAHPGLILEVLPKDTLGLRQIPASFSGWSARARYDGPGGTATTERATITIRAPYSEIIETYRTVYRSGTGNLEKGISELVNSHDFLGYAEMDLNGDGIQELILASDGNNDYPFIIYEIYTLKNGIPLCVAKTQARERYFMMNDGRFLMEGSNSAISSCWITYRFNGAELTLQEQIWTSDEPHDMADFAPYYYYCGELYGPTEPMIYDEAASTIERWEWRVTLPSLKAIK